MEIITTLGINGKLLLAQVVNFAIIAGVLTYFIYRPILRLIDARRESIRKSMEDVEKIERQKQEMEEVRKATLKKIEVEASKLLDQAKAGVSKEKDRLMEAAKKEADDVLRRGKQELEAERSRITSDFEKSASTLVVRLTEKLLEREFASADQERLLKTLETAISSPAHAKK
jgi:F-type H+-transporting ATPase subunit b